jgi:5-methylcytosine-specific restriction protein B
MKIFFGKIASKFDPKQFQQGYYDTDSESWFNGIDVGDYAFVISGPNIELWQAKKWTRNGAIRLDFEKKVTGIGGRTAGLIAFKYFKLFPTLLSATTKSLRNIAFVPIPLSKPISEIELVDPKTYQNADYFRRIIVHESRYECDAASEDLQLYLAGNKLQIFPASFIEGETFTQFRDNRDQIGGGRPKKDKTLRAFSNITSFPCVFSFDTVNLRDVYEAFGVPYEKAEEAEEGTETSDFPKTSFKMEIPLNQILYGPPGTGKTFHTINHALAIIENKTLEAIGKEKREDLLARFNNYHKEKQVEFTTFHQSMSYEDFVEGIKPVKAEDAEFVRYEVLPGIFKSICEKAKAKSIVSNNFDNAYASLLQEIKDNKGSLVLESLVYAKEFTIYENSKGNLKFHANTEKAYEGVLLKGVIKEYLISGNALDWPSYTKAVAEHMRKKHKYSQTEKEEAKPHVLIIDEINRGNISQIFGELITLLETDKRIGNEEALKVTLPYSKIPFSVPSNLYLIGTMNTADRSIEALDTALRRRFSFVEMPPNEDLLTPSEMFWRLMKRYETVPWNDKVYREKERKLFDFLGATDKVEAIKVSYWKKFEGGNGETSFSIEHFSGFRLDKLLRTINLRIEKLLDKDHLIGHSYFLNVSSIEDLQNTFYRNIIPLLQEYFFGDYGKIGLVLGAGFVEVVKSEGDFADFSAYEDTAELNERRIYRIKKEGEWREGEFEIALKLLLKTI